MIIARNKFSSVIFAHSYLISSYKYTHSIHLPIVYDGWVDVFVGRIRARYYKCQGIFVYEIDVIRDKAKKITFSCSS